MESLEEVLAGGNIWVFLLALALDALREGAEINFSARVNEERHRKPATSVVVWVYNSMRGALQDAIGEVLKHIAGVDNNLPVEGMDSSPATITLKKL